MNNNRQSLKLNLTLRYLKIQTPKNQNININTELHVPHNIVNNYNEIIYYFLFYLSCKI